MLKINVSAPGKTILHGEHAVVFGKAAIALSLNLRTHLLFITNMENKIELYLKKLNIKKTWEVEALKNISQFYKNTYPENLPENSSDVIPASEDNIKYIKQIFEIEKSKDILTESQQHAVTAFLYLLICIVTTYNGSFPACKIEIDSELTVGSGMGSSASFSVCVAAVFLKICNQISTLFTNEEKQLINIWAYQAETIFHGAPSGIDNSICTYGGAIMFANGVNVETFSEIPHFNILLVDTKVSRSTKAIVNEVKHKEILFPHVINSIMEAIHAISNECWKMFKNSNKQSLKPYQELIKMNQHLLNSLGVGHLQLNRIYNIAENYKFVSKLTGAGGGGSAIILLSFEEEYQEIEYAANKLKEELIACGFDVWDVILGGPGVQINSENL